MGGRAFLLTPPGAAAIAVVRLSGDSVGSFLAAHFDKPVPPGRCVHGELREGSRVVDDAVVVLSPDGAAADLNVHGGPWVVQSVLDLARRCGFAIVEPTGLPLPADAVDADDDVGREVLQYLPLARTDLAVRALLAQGDAWRSLLRSPPNREAAELLLNDRGLYWLLHPPRVAIVGVPNAGKSTLANQLFAQERSITADLPGTTRDWVGDIANVGGLAVTLVDTPGLRDTTDPIEREAIGRARGEVAAADLVVLVLDSTGADAPEQARLDAEFPHALRVVNKVDRASADWAGSAIRTVATTGEGVDVLRSAIRAHFLGAAPFDTTKPRCWTPRQRGLLESVVNA